MAEELYKQPSESRLYHFIFTNLLSSGEVIELISSVAQVNLGKVAGSSALTIGSQSYSDNAIQIRISGGTVGESYKLTAIGISSVGNILEVDGILHVKEL